jgi:photosystem II stability/assembly factor-like uncharacterized protein
LQLFKRPSLRALLAAAALAVGFVAPVFAGINHWTSNGPFGGEVSALVMDPKDPSILYATASHGGLYKSVDGAATWRLLSPDSIQVLAVDPVSTSTIYASGERVLKTTDSGETWQDLGLEGAIAIAIDPRNPATVYASVSGAFTSGGVYKSLDGGEVWSHLTGLPPSPLGNAEDVAMDAGHPDSLYAFGAGTSAVSVYRSADGGATWNTTGSLGDGVHAFRISVDPTTSSVYVSSDQGIFRSTDGGTTWANVLAGPFQRVTAVRTSEVYALGSYSTGLFQSTDGGDHWAFLSTSLLPVVNVVAGSAIEPATVYAGGYPSGVTRSTDGGRTWTAVSQGIRGLVALTIAMDPGHPADVYAGSEAGLFHSGDGGGSWSLANSAVGPVVVQPGTVDLYSGLGRSADGGVTFQSLPYPDGSTLPAIVANSPQTFFVGNSVCYGRGYSYPARVSRSTDGGATWTVVLDPGIDGCSSVVVSASGQDVYATIQGFNFRGVFVSHDGGLSWGSLPTSPWGFIAPTFLTVDPTNHNVVYTLNPEVLGVDKLWVSTVGGGQWRDITAGLPTPLGVSKLVVDPVSPATLYVATSSGVYRSLDRGGSWSPFKVGLPDGAATDLAIDGTGRFLHVTVGGSVSDYEIPGACTASAVSLCLLGGRFLATVEALDPRTGRQEIGHGLVQSDRWGYFSLPGFTGDPNFPEIVVKMVDSTSFGGGFWVFHTGLTDLQYTLSVVDTVTGRQKSYSNDRSDPQSLCGGADTETFTTEPIADAQSGAPRFARVLPGEGSPALDLLGRFQATLSAVDPRTGRTANGIAVPQGAKWGYFSLPTFTNDPTFPEVFVKMLDATALPGRYFWLFHTGLTDLEYTLTVTDQVTGEQKTYRNDRSDPSRLCGGADTQAFQ